MQESDKQNKKFSDVEWPEVANTTRREFPSPAGRKTSGGKFPNEVGLIIIFILIVVVIVSIALFLHNRQFGASRTPQGGIPPESLAEFGKTGNSGLPAGNFLNSLEIIFKDGAGSIVGLGSLALEMASLAEEVVYLEHNVLHMLLNSQGEALISRLESISARLQRMQETEEELQALAANLSAAASSSEINPYLAIKLDLLRAEENLNAAIAWLKAPEPHHILVMLQNSSEIRPTGGFLGSYADVVIHGGNITSVEIYDINDPDRELGLKTIPPKPLQVLVKNWRAADANWFFDFPKSASSVLHFLEASDFYQTKGINFDAVIAVSPRVIRDALEAIGPVAAGGISFTAENFLIEIQKSVQVGLAKKQAQGGVTYPKEIVQELGRILLTKLAGLGETGEFFDMLSNWVEHKDVIAYFEDAGLQNPAVQYGISGDVYEFPEKFQGDYFALVEANIGGGKADLFTKRDVVIQSQINKDGTVANRVTVTFEHKGNTSEHWWYKTPNQTFVELFVPPSSRVTHAEGGSEKNIAAPLNYSKNGYASYPLVAEIEGTSEKTLSHPSISTHKESGKKVFSTWSKLAPGEKKKLTIGYTHRLFLEPADGQVYTFVFERQPGIERTYELSISAPPGFIFRENKLPIFEYETDDPSGRMLIELTLVEHAIQ